MSLQTLADHPERCPVGVAGIAFLGALLGKAVTEAWAARHPQTRPARGVVASPHHLHHI